MKPLLRSGEWIGVDWCEPSAGAHFKRGDLVLGRATDRVWLVHRLVAEDHEGGIVLKGDASMATELLGRDQAWGRVVAFRSATDSPVRAVRTNELDRVIAFLSACRLRRTVWLLARFRRWMLGMPLGRKSG
jgi:hypothetical protein